MNLAPCIQVMQDLRTLSRTSLGRFSPTRSSTGRMTSPTCLATWRTCVARTQAASSPRTTSSCVQKSSWSSIFSKRLATSSRSRLLSESIQIKSSRFSSEKLKSLSPKSYITASSRTIQRAERWGTSKRKEAVLRATLEKLEIHNYKPNLLAQMATELKAKTKGQVYSLWKPTVL